MRQRAAAPGRSPSGARRAAVRAQASHRRRKARFVLAAAAVQRQAEVHAHLCAPLRVGAAAGPASVVIAEPGSVSSGARAEPVHFLCGGRWYGALLGLGLAAALAWPLADPQFAQKMAVVRLDAQPIAALRPHVDAKAAALHLTSVGLSAAPPEQAVVASLHTRDVPVSAITDAMVAAITARAEAASAPLTPLSAPVVHIAPDDVRGVAVDRLARPSPSGSPLAPASPGAASTQGRELARLQTLLPVAQAADAPLAPSRPVPHEPLEADVLLSDAVAGAGGPAPLCQMAAPVAAVAQASLPDPGTDAFGEAVAAAALQQTRDFVVYTDAYRSISYPMGDVPSLFGVCTDVVIRAFRAVGIDLQARVYAARVGSRDPSIAHRRTATLRRYFAARGASLPISNFAEDYRPGDIVTYTRPGNRGSQDHIAVVSAIQSPSGRPMIVHNRGWGPQLEDALFGDQITGHYRYRPAVDEPAEVVDARAGGRLPVLRPAKNRRQIAGQARLPDRQSRTLGPTAHD